MRQRVFGPCMAAELYTPIADTSGIVPAAVVPHPDLPWALPGVLATLRHTTNTRIHASNFYMFSIVCLLGRLASDRRILVRQARLVHADIHMTWSSA
jgi:hypothetical protein